VIFLCFGLVLPFIVKGMGPVAMHYMMGGIVLVGNLGFVIGFIKETAGLNDREKKTLYAKGN
jgi:hypothetical protein